ncbi:MAG: TetR/AcrR family transcriptional regulator [Candidatus Marinimicrobia bacterium]|nr:TetR/AcrR family transcriptional regulator [Candidatus Neomarinimicrobiota bacterium]MCF7828595.1 TetR/AcrR family transcriptional regulator [Candidatus Neomarinimicrobiota bacterium]MCF7880336.1 TetR/AcrR family transcriptional regulator [Candidatus Neomarinimicrobiota bacterium]
MAGSKKIGRRKQPDERKKEIIDAARDLFASQGYDNTTMQQVVEKAGTSIGNCYFYFSNKKELYQGVVESVNEEISGVVDTAIREMNSPYEKLAAAVYYGARTVLELSESAGAILTGTDHPEIRRNILNHYTRRIYRFLKRNPVITGDINLELASAAWQGAIFNLIERQTAGQFDGDAQTVARFLVRWNLRALNAPDAEINSALETVERHYREEYGSGDEV